jgi:cytochrome P450
MIQKLAPLPAGPKSSPVWQLFRYTFSPLPFLEGCARRFGDPFTLRLAGFGTLVMLADPDAARDVFHGDPQSLHSGEGNEFLALSVGRNSVIVLDEAPHARQRRVLLPPLKGDRMRSYFDAMQEETRAAARAWAPGRAVRTDEPMRAVTLRVILRAVLGRVGAAEMEAVERKVHHLLDAGRTRYGLMIVQLIARLRLQGLPYTPWTAYFRHQRDLDDSLFSLIAARRRAPAAERGDNILADLLAATHEDGTPLTDQEIRDDVATILFAGHETTAVALAWALEQITARPDVMQEITEELSRVTGGGAPRADQLHRLDYLDAAVRESLRRRTILPFVVRLTKRPFTAGGREYPPGVLLCPCNHLVHHRPDLYPEPAAFRPERFLRRKFAGHEWFPFGGGDRTCLGMAFALYEMKVVLSTLLAEVRLERPAAWRSAPVRRGVVLAPDDGARVVVREAAGR